MRKEGALWGRILSVFLCMVFIAISSAAEAFFLPDTGQTTCYIVKGPLKVVECPSPGKSSAQDGSYTINTPSFAPESFGAAFDNNTGLMWQHRSSDVAQTCDEAFDYCNNLTLGGYTDWRLPTSKELVTIMDYQHCEPALNPNVFVGPIGACYSSIPSAQYPGTMLIVSSYDGLSGVNPCIRYSYAYVRCVRGDKLIFNDFTETGNGTVTDIATGLQWQKDEAGTKSWETALSYCESLSLGGRSQERRRDSIWDERMGRVSA
jgi:hypothetical protein